MGIERIVEAAVRHGSGGPWRRVGGRPSFLLIWAALLLAMLVGVVTLAFSTAEDVLAAIPVLRARPARALADGTDGPGVFAGELRGRESVTPTGKSAVAWVAWIDVTTRSSSSSGSSSTTRELCSVSTLDGLALRDGNEQVDLDLSGSNVTLIRSASIKGPTGDDIAVLLRPVAEGQQPPSSMLERPECRHESGTLTYYEYAAVLDEPAAVSGCRKGSTIVPCRDAADFLATHCPAAGGTSACSEGPRAVASLLTHWTSGVRVLVLVMTLVAAAALTGMAIFHFIVARRVQRRRSATAKVG